MRDPLSLLFSELSPHLTASSGGESVEWQPRLLHAPESTGFDWAVPLENGKIDLDRLGGLAGDLLGKCGLSGQYFNFCWSEQAILRGMAVASFPLDLRFDSSLRRPEMAAALKEARGMMKQFRRRLGGLERRLVEFQLLGQPVFSAASRAMLAQQWKLLNRLEGHPEAWSGAAVARLVEAYGNALVHFWEMESIDSQDGEGQTALRLRVWEAQMATVEALSKAIVP